MFPVIDTMGAEQLREEIKRYVRINANFIKMLSLVAKQVRACTGCGTTVYMVEHANRKIAPYTTDGLNHFADCPMAQQFRKTK